MIRDVLALERVAKAAEMVVREYRSHGGKGTHQECMPGCQCRLPADVAVLDAALKAAQARREA